MIEQLCGNCEDPLTPDEVEFPSDPWGTGAVCGDCERDWWLDNSFECPLCSEEVEDSEESVFFILFDQEYGAPGLYKALRFPFYAQPMIGAPMLWLDAVQRMGDVPPTAYQDESESAAMMICTECIIAKDTHN